MVADDLEIEFEDEEDEEEEERPRRYRRSESLFGISKEDVIIILLTIAFGAFIGYWFSKTTQKKEIQYQHPFPFPFMHHERQQESPLPVEQKEHKHPGVSYETKGKKKRGGYYLDRDGNAIMESPAVHESWTIRRDMEGNIIDAFKNPGQEWVK